VIPNPNGEHAIENYIQSCIRNEREGQQALYKHFYGFAMGICLRYANDRLDAAGILNDGFYKVFKNIEKYESGKPFKAWFGRIMTNTAIDHYRSNLKFADHVDIADYDDIGQERFIYAKLAYNDLLALIQNLSPSYRTVFNLFAIDGYSHEEIGEMLRFLWAPQNQIYLKQDKNCRKCLKHLPHLYMKEKLRLLTVKMYRSILTRTHNEKGKRNR
jgi:RNA polymerase sigma factor (sigma-70 family)